MVTIFLPATCEISVWQERTASNFRPISSDAKALDGLNVQVAVCDEIASHRTSEVYDVLLTAMGKRRHPLLLSISTATGDNAGIGKQLWDYAVRVLESTQTPDEVEELVAAALKSVDGRLALTDERGRKVIVPANLVAYVEIAQADVRRVGFVSSN